MQVLSQYLNDEEDELSPTSNHPKSALVNTEESERLLVVNIEESEELPVALVNRNTVKVKVSIKDNLWYGIELVPMDNLVRAINDNLRNYSSCQPSNRLELKLDRRVGFASNWKLSCMTCDTTDRSELNNLYHLQRQMKKCTNYRN